MFFICVWTTANAQDDIDLNTTIGFGCSASGRQTEVVAKFTYLLSTSDFGKCQELIESENNAEKVLAAFVCRKLNKEKRVSLSNETLNKIELIYNSEEEIAVCGGCKFYKIQIKKFLAENKKNAFYKEAKAWFKMYLK
ncbi:hypothetical protein [Flavobacterium rivulicola]|nr:hypothetical protein [Flavobacterium sp. IMCC34852]